MRFSSIRNRFLRWFLRCAWIGLIIGTLYGIVFASLSASPKALLLIPLDFGFSLVLACIFWPVASRLRIYPQSRFVRIVEGTLHGAIIGAIMLMPFSEGWVWAAYQAVTGAIIGGLLGTVFATLFRWRPPCATAADSTQRA
jgi:hypothetical protein